MNDTRHAILKELISFGKDFQKTHIADIHHQNSVENRNIKHDLLNFDYSKQRVDDDVLDYLIQIPDLIDLKESLAALFSGHMLNPSE